MASSEKNKRVFWKGSGEEKPSPSSKGMMSIHFLWFWTLTSVTNDFTRRICSFVTNIQLITVIRLRLYLQMSTLQNATNYFRANWQQHYKSDYHLFQNRNNIAKGTITTCNKDYTMTPKNKSASLNRYHCIYTGTVQEQFRWSHCYSQLELPLPTSANSSLNPIPFVTLNYNVPPLLNQCIPHPNSSLCKIKLFLTSLLFFFANHLHSLSCCCHLHLWDVSLWWLSSYSSLYYHI